MMELPKRHAPSLYGLPVQCVCKHARIRLRMCVCVWARVCVVGVKVCVSVYSLVPPVPPQYPLITPLAAPW